MTITISTPDTPGLLPIILEGVQKRRIVGQTFYPGIDRTTALTYIENLSIMCDDPNARTLFRGLHKCLTSQPEDVDVG